MNHSYLLIRRWTFRHFRQLLLLLTLLLPVLAQAQTFTITPSDPASPQNFGSVLVGSSSASKSYAVSASGLTPNQGAIGVSLSGASYEISRDNTLFTGTAFELIADASGNISTTVYARFTPTGGTTPFVINRNLNFSSDEAPARNVSFALTGTRVAGTPNITIDPDARFFSAQTVNTASAPQSVSVSATSLTAPIIVTAPVGYEVSNSGVNGGAFSASISIPQGGGTVNTTVNIRFVPNTSGTINGIVTLASNGATTRNVNVSGTGTAPAPSLTANPTSLDFGTQRVGSNSAAQSFRLTGENLTGNVTVTAPNGYEIRTGTAGFSPNPLSLAPQNGGLDVMIDVRFVPGADGPITGNITAIGNGSAQATVAVSGTGSPAPTEPTINATPLAVDFGTVTNSGSAQTQTFTVSATNLTGPLTLTPSNANIQFRNLTAGGGSFVSTLEIQRNASGNITNQTIEVTLVPTVVAGNFSGSIGLTSPSAVPVNVNITANNPSGSISDISLTAAILREFSTSPGVPSSIQSYKVSADNLLQDLTILAPQFFQISLTADVTAPGGFNSLGTTTGNTLVLPRIQGSSTTSLNGDVEETTIFVRYFPPAAQTNRGQVVSNSSAPARTQFVSVNGSSEPEINVLGFFTPVVNQVKNTLSAIQTLTIEGARLNSPVIVRVPQDPEPPTTASPLNPDRTPQFQISLQSDFSDLGTTANPTGFQIVLVPDANDSLFNVPVYVRYAPTRVGSALADLLFRTPDLNNNVEFNRVPNARLQGRSIDVEPTRQSAATIIRSSNGTSVTINFTQEDGSTFPGNPEAAGFGENRLIIASLNPTLTVGFFPQDATPYDPGNNIYGRGTNLNGNFVVFASSAVTAVITGLDPGTKYYFFGFEYNNDQVGGAENYKTPNLPINVQQPLPVELKSFTAQLRNGQVNLNWVTASENNNKGFEVQRSQDAREFSTILFKQGNGTTSGRSTYDAVDTRPLAGLSYYRLKQIDTDGKFSYSPVATVKNAGLTEASFYPNPTSGKLTVALPQVTTAEGLRVRISDLTGRVLREQTLPVTGELDLTSLPAGTYMVTVGTGDQQVTRKVVKN